MKHKRCCNRSDLENRRGRYNELYVATKVSSGKENIGVRSDAETKDKTQKEIKVQSVAHRTDTNAPARDKTPPATGKYKLW